MLILRLVLLLSAVLVVLSGGMYLLTQQPRYLRFAWHVVRLIVVTLVAFGLLFALERYVLVGWRLLV